MTKIRNILLVGKTGAGKSTLANVITETNKFKVGSGMTSETEVFHQEILEREGIKYRVVDTIGVDDNKGLTEKEVLYRIAQGVCMMEDGITQVFFVINKRFDKREIEIFEAIREIIFDKGIIRFITIVRTDFEEFDDPEVCEEQTKSLKDRRDVIGEIARNCNGIIYTSNPSADIKIKESFSERKKQDKLQELERNKAKRKVSRGILLEHLEKNCQSFYCPGYWQKIKLNAYAYINEKFQAEERLKAEEEKKKVEKEVQRRLEIERRQEKIRKEAEEAKRKAAEATKKELKAAQISPSPSSSSSGGCGCTIL